MKFLREDQAHLYLDILVVPNARQTEIVGEHDGRLKLKVHAPPVDGKANEEILLFFSKFFSLPKSQISILKGSLGRKKIVAIVGLSYARAVKELVGVIS